MALSKTALSMRRIFRSKYGNRTASILKLYALKRHLNWRSNEIANKLDVSPRSVAATLANLTRGTYKPFAQASQDDVTGKCKF